MAHVLDLTQCRECALNNAVTLQFLERGFHGDLYYHDRWDGKYHAPQTHDQRAADNRDDDYERMNVHNATENKRLKYNVVQYTSDPDQNQHIERQIVRVQSRNQRCYVFRD